jgi:hypothetical protein
LQALEALREQFGRLGRQAAEGMADTDGITFDVGRGQSNCPICRAETGVQKTSTRHVETLAHGHFIALEHVTSCPRGCLHPDGKLAIGHSEALAGLVPHGARYGYDIEVFVGTERFLNHAQREEIQKRLSSRYGIGISVGEISNLARRFLAHIESLHHRQAHLIRAALEADGGYPMHIDATTESGKGTMLVVYSGWRRWALGSWKIPSERTEYIEPRIAEIAGLFGEPCSIMRDLGRPMRKAAEGAGAQMAFPPRQKACHFHFLKDVGCGLLDKSYAKLRDLVKSFDIRANVQAAIRALRHGVKTEDIARFQATFDSFISGGSCPQLAESIPGTIVVILLGQWVQEYRQDSGNASFPFAQPFADLFSRCKTAFNALGVLQTRAAISGSANNNIQRLQKAIQPFLQSADVAQALGELNNRVALFDNLRAIFELDSIMPQKILGLDSGCAKKADELSHEEAKAFEKSETKMKSEAEAFLASLKTKHKMLAKDNDLKDAAKIIIDHLDCHWQYLWGHIVKLQAGGDTIYRLIERTNNMLESYFHRLKHRERRRSGRKNLDNDFESMPASIAIASNLMDDEYIKIVSGSLDALPSLFSQIDQCNRTAAHLQEAPSISGNDSAAAVQCDFPNNKKFVRKAIFNDWVKDLENNFSSVEPSGDTISTCDPISPYAIIDNLLSQSIPGISIPC